jgi:hypothetical protein
MSPNHFFVKINTQQVPWKTSVIFKPLLPKVNNRPIGEHSPNLVTLNSRSFLGTGNSFQNGFPENLISLRKMVKKTPPISKGKKLRDAYCR